MQNSQIEEIRNKLNIVDVVGSYVKLTKTGVNHRGVCPFHSEKGPSFFVSPARQMWHCFGCGAGSSIYDFIMQIEGIEFGDALRILANKAGVELKRENPQIASDRKKLYEICELGCSFFEKQLGASGWGEKARDYLLQRGITEESIKKWRVGYSPDTWQALSDFVVSRGYAREDIVRAGLAVKSDKGNQPYDRFRGRIIFPIFDLNSQVIGFGGRVFKDADKKETAKYINTPQTPLYDKSAVLYGINFAKLPIRKQLQCILTEGYTDAIMCHQAGFENTVAVSGTALTPRHLNLLKRYSDNLLLAFDMDLAGDTATKRGINLAESEGFNIKIADTYSEAKDPAEIIAEDPQKWKNSLEKARTIMEFYFDTSFSKFDKKTPDGKKSIGQVILPAVKRIKNKIEQSHWVQKIAEALEVKEEAVLEELKGVKLDNNFQSISSQSSAKVIVLDLTTEGRKKLLEEKIISLILKTPESIEVIKEEHFNLFSEKIKNIIEEFKKIEFLGEKNSLDRKKGDKITEENDKLRLSFSSVAEKDEYGDLMNTLSLKAEIELLEDEPDEIQTCLFNLNEINIKNELNKITEQLRAEKDPEREKELLKEHREKSKLLNAKA